MQRAKSENRRDTVNGKGGESMPDTVKKPAKRKPKKTAKAKLDGRSKRGKYEKWLTEDGLLKLEAWSRDGLPYEDIAHNVGISVSTLKEWRNKYPAISEALSRAREVADIRLENSMYQQATGYTYDEIIKVPKLNPETGKVELVIDKVITRWMAPDYRATSFLMRNRMPEKWRDKPPEMETERGDSVEVVFDVDEEEEQIAENNDSSAAAES
jgi:hypothetical protein